MEVRVMKCTDVIKILSAYIDNELPSEEHKEIKEHLIQCVSCTTEYELLTKIGDSLLQWDETVTVSPAFTENLMQKIQKEKREFVPMLERIQRLFNLANAAPVFATLFFGIFLGHYVGTVLYPYRDNNALVFARTDGSHSLHAKVDAIDEYIFDDILN